MAKELGRLNQQPRGRFHESMIADLPAPAQRYFRHALRPGALLVPTVRIQMHGTIQLRKGGTRMPMQASELLAPPRGFLWEARAGAGLLRFSGADFYLESAGQMAFRIWDILPVVRASGPDIARSGRGRLAGEAVWNPAALLPGNGVSWQGQDERTARATVTINGEPLPLTMTIDADGRLRAVMLERWGNQTDDGSYALISFGMDVLEERTFGDYTVPSRVAGGWWYGSDRYFDFFHAEVEQLEIR